MKALKLVALALLGYVALVVLFESMLGFFQPQGGDTIVITSFDAEGDAHERVVSRLETGGSLYVAANHWPRAWYRRVLEHPDVLVEIDGGEGRYVAVPVTPDEHDRVNADHPLGLVFPVLAGFPPRRFLRLDPR
jgi:hypothetical protein